MLRIAIEFFREEVGHEKNLGSVFLSNLIFFFVWILSVWMNFPRELIAYHENPR